MTENVNVRACIPKDLNKAIKLYSVDKEIHKETVIAMAIEEGMKVLKGN